MGRPEFIILGVMVELGLQSVSCSIMSDSLRPSWTVALPTPLSMGSSRQEYWSGLPCPPPGDLPNPGIKPTSLESPALAGGFFTTSLWGRTELDTTEAT